MPFDEHLRLPGHGVLNGGDTAPGGIVLPACATGALQRHARQVRLPVAVDGKVQVVLWNRRPAFEVVHRHRGCTTSRWAVGQHGHATQVFGRVERQLGVYTDGLITSAPTSHSSSVAIGRPLAHRSAPRLPLAPALFSTITFCLSDSDSTWLMDRADDVRTAAGGKGTMMRHRLVGHSAAFCVKALAVQQGKAYQYGGAAKDGQGIVRW